jgi:hypothetical protein
MSPIITSVVIDEPVDRVHSGLAVDTLHIVTAVLVAGGAWASLRGVGLVARGLSHADDPSASLWLVRGIRGIVVAVGVGALAAGLFFEQLWLRVFGLVFLAEELYETGVLALILRAGRRQTN